MNPFCFSNLAAIRVVSTHNWRHLTAAVASALCLWAWAADGAPPANDNRANATAITGASMRLTGISNVDATKEIGEPDHAGNAGGKSIWFRWSTPATAPVSTRFHTVGTTFDTLMAAYTTNLAGQLVLATGTPNPNDDALFDFFSISGG